MTDKCHTSDLPLVQPMPVRNDLPFVWDLVIEDVQSGELLRPKKDYGSLISNMRLRDKKGMEKYGVHLQPDNGRDPIWDLLDEVLDGVAYSKQAIEEGIEVQGVYAMLVAIADYLVDRFDF